MLLVFPLVPTFALDLAASGGKCWNRNARGFGQARMQRRDDRELRELLVKLRDEHRQLDQEIVALEASATLADQLAIKRLKKKKLLLKDQITAVEDQLTPDIIA
jgi:hypothetical protein